MEKEEHWKLLDSFTSDTPTKGSVEVKQYLTPQHLKLLNQLIELNEKHHEFIAGLEDGGHDLDTLDRAGSYLQKGLTLLAGSLALSATYS